MLDMMLIGPTELRDRDSDSLESDSSLLVLAGPNIFFTVSSGGRC